jgi:hypothetical protein
MISIFKSTLIFFLFLSFFCNAFAQTPAKKSTPVRFLFGGALELGGDKIADIYFTNGETQSVRAGQGISLAAGGQLQIPGAEKWLLRSTVGFKYVTTAADNAHIRLTRVPIVVSGSYMATQKLRFGAGLSMHTGIRFKTDGLGDDYKFKGANGPIFEISYAGVGLTYTLMKYKDQENTSYSANAIGISFSMLVPGK